MESLLVSSLFSVLFGYVCELSDKVLLLLIEGRIVSSLDVCNLASMALLLSF